MVVKMRYDSKVAAALLVIFLLMLLATSIYITPLEISDADPSSYVVVPILMLPLLAIFSLKNNPKPDVKERDLKIGIAVFAVFLLLSVLVRLYFSLLFTNFRIDMLLMPLAIAALVSMLFGLKNLEKFKVVMGYSLLASPALLYPIIAQGVAFTRINTLIVYDLVKLFISSASYSPPITISANGYSVGIGQTCVSLGVFVALALFLIPVAYLYEGRKKDKVIWVVSGVALLLVLNLIRMFGASMIWFNYGPNAALFLAHKFVGVLLFYLAIVSMILGSGLFKLSVKKYRSKKVRQAPIGQQFVKWSVAASLAFSLAYVLLTLNYSSASSFSPLALGNRQAFNYSDPQVASAVKSVLNRNNFTSVVFAAKNGTYAIFTIGNATISFQTPLVLYLSSPTANPTGGFSKDNVVIGSEQFFNSNGARSSAYDIISNKTEFLMYYTILPIPLANLSSQSAGAYIVAQKSVLPYIGGCGSYDRFYSYLVDLPSAKGYNRTVANNLLGIECVSNRIVWS